jgi:hypothetical protein
MLQKEITDRYLAAVRGRGSAGPVEERVRDLWWPHFIDRLDVEKVPLAQVLDELDVCMDKSRGTFLKMAGTYAEEQGFAEGSRDHIQRSSQFLKSNTGKMFERFIGYALAESLERIGSPFAAYGFNVEGRKLIPGVKYFYDTY